MCGVMYVSYLLNNVHPDSGASNVYETNVLRYA